MSSSVEAIAVACLLPSWWNFEFTATHFTNGSKSHLNKFTKAVHSQSAYTEKFCSKNTTVLWEYNFCWSFPSLICAKCEVILRRGNWGQSWLRWWEWICCKASHFVRSYSLFCASLFAHMTAHSHMSHSKRKWSLNVLWGIPTPQSRFFHKQIIELSITLCTHKSYQIGIQNISNSFYVLTSLLVSLTVWQIKHAWFQIYSEEIPLNFIYYQRRKSREMCRKGSRMKDKSLEESFLVDTDHHQWAFDQSYMFFTDLLGRIVWSQ